MTRALVGTAGWLPTRRTPPGLVRQTCSGTAARGRWRAGVLMPLVLVRLETDGTKVEAPALIDSGADSSVLGWRSLGEGGCALATPYPCR